MLATEKSIQQRVNILRAEIAEISRWPPVASQLCHSTPRRSPIACIGKELMFMSVAGYVNAIQKDQNSDLIFSGRSRRVRCRCTRHNLLRKPQSRTPCRIVSDCQ